MGNIILQRRSCSSNNTHTWEQSQKPVFCLNPGPVCILETFRTVRKDLAHYDPIMIEEFHTSINQSLLMDANLQVLSDLTSGPF